MKFHIYQSKDGRWRWVASTKNGQHVAHSAKSYGRMFDTKKALQKFRYDAYSADLVVNGKDEN